ncbi:MAG: hypothetical protein HY356_07130 [Gammaproteobacteria bacterium]|nr:hypothetical protein [Gammaproteobacteria bacterium]
MLEGHSHRCCPFYNGENKSSGHMHDQDKCVSCEAVEPVLNSADTIVQTIKLTNAHYQPLISGWNDLQIKKTVSVSFDLLPPSYLPVHPTLLYCVLLI